MNGSVMNVAVMNWSVLNGHQTVHAQVQPMSAFHMARCFGFRLCCVRLAKAWNTFFC